MRNIVLIIFTLIISESCTNKQNKKLSAEQIWEKYIIATYGNENPKIYSRCAKIKTTIDTLEINTIIKVKSPDKVYQDIKVSNGNHVINILNEGKGKKVYPNKVMKMTQDEISFISKIATVFPELSYSQPKLLGVEKVENRDCYIIQNGLGEDIFTYHIDCETFLIHKSKLNDATLEVIERKKIGQLTLFKSYTITDENGTSFVEYIEDDLNCRLADSIFFIE
jgi:hypothetical protein